MNTKRIILSSIAALTMMAAMVSASTTLSQSVYAFTWPCIDRSEGKAPIAVSGNNMYVAWWGNGTGNFDIMFKASNDNGQTFGDKINLSNSPNGTSVEAAVAAAGNNVYVTYWDNKTGIGRAYLRASTDNGHTFRPAIVLSDPSDVAYNPGISAQTKAQLEKLYNYEMKVAAAGNNVYVVANGAEPGVANGPTFNDKLTSPPDIYIKSSIDNGQTFGKQINLSNSTGIISNRAEIAASGKNVYVSWWDTVNGKDQPMMSISHDGGQTFGKPIILTANFTSTSASSSTT